MKLKKLLLSALALSILSACNETATNTSINNDSIETFAQKKTNKNVEELVSKERMEGYLKSLTGKTPIQSGSIIPERGTVEGRDMTRAYLTKTLEGLGYKVEVHNYRKNGSNIMAKLMADTPTDEYLLVGAHMDSVRNAGADDNASGSTAVLEAATVLQKLEGRKVNIIFAWFDEEELGLIGSGYLAKDFKKKGMKIIAAHTIDMMGFDGDGDKTVELARPDGVLWSYYQMVNKTHNLNFPLDRTNTGQSDHVSFHDNGFNSICLSEEWTAGDTTPQYHRKGDVFETINLDYLVSGSKLVIATVGDMSLKVPAPANIQLEPHNKYPSRERHFHKSIDDMVH
jgi:hypothetical protein